MQEVLSIPGSAEVVQAAGPWDGLPGHCGTCEIPLSETVGVKGTASLWFCLPSPVTNGPGVEAGAVTILALPGVGALKSWWYSGYVCLLWEMAEGKPTLAVEIPGIPAGKWLHAFFTWDACEGRLEGALNGTPVRVGDFRVPAWKVEHPATRCQIGVPDWTIAGVRIAPETKPLATALDEVPGKFRGALDHMLGKSEPTRFEHPSPAKRTIFENDLSFPECAKGWIMEGPGEVSFHEGWMRLKSMSPDAPGPDGHIVYWSDTELPAEFLLEFDVRILSETGLNILFFAARGCGGEDVFDPGLKERTGVFGQYLNGDIDCYHVSYYADTPDVRGRPTSNLRKNKGFFLVDNGPVGIPPGSREIHHFALLRTGGRIRVAVDDRCVLDWTDDGVQYGPVLGGGRFAFRQMKWTIAEYRNLRVSIPDSPAGQSQTR